VANGDVTCSTLSHEVKEAIIPSIRRLLVAVTVTAALVGRGLPAGAGPAPGPVEGTEQRERWGPLRRVPVPKDWIEILVTVWRNVRDVTHRLKPQHRGDRRRDLPTIHDARERARVITS
jgi:hypothetical protein